MSENSSHDSLNAPTCEQKRLGSVASVSVIVPVRNEEAHIAKTLDQLLELDRGDLDVEFLIVDGDSTDGTRAIVAEYARLSQELSLLDNPSRVSSAARNIGIQHSRGEFIVVIDGHCEIPASDYLHRLVDAFVSSGADCLGRPQQQHVTNPTMLQRVIAVARSSWLGHHPGSFVYSDLERDVPAISVAVAYRRSVFDEIGLFDASFDAGEDCEFNYRIDKSMLRCHFVPELAINYIPRTSLISLFQQMSRYGRGRIRLSRKHPESFNLASILPALIPCALAAPLVCWAMPFLWPPYLIAITIYLTIVLLASFQEIVRGRDVSLWMLPAAFVTIHMGAGAGVIIETVSGWRRHR